MGASSAGVMGGSPVRGDAPASAASPAAPAVPDALTIAQRESERKDEVIRQLLTRAPAQSNDLAPAPVLPQHPGPAPDAIREPEKFQRWADATAAYNQGMVRAAVIEGRNEINETQQRDRLWGLFQQKFPELTGDLAMCRYAFQAELEKNGGRVPGEEAAFVESIGNRLSKFRGAKAGEAAPAAGDAQRTAGLSGGSSAGSEPRIVDPTRGPVSDATKGKNFADQLEDIRQKRLPDLFG